jgi:glycosyltransferase involved in cell wall biosynthesis
VGISKSILNEHLSRGFFKGCSNTVVYNGVEKSAISRSPDTDIIRFGFVGRLTPQKGIEWLITAFCDPEIMAKSSLEIIGESIVPKGAAITFRGHLPAAEVMSDINILVTPSMWREPFGRAVAEAQAAGIPVIGNDIGGVGEIIVDGETGFLIKRDIPTSLIEAMLKFIRNSSLTKEMLPACISNAERFRVDVMASKYLEVYNEVINSN